MSHHEIQAKDKAPAFDHAESAGKGTYYKPLTDIFEDGEKVVLTMDMPGVQNSDLEIKIQDNLMRLTGKVNRKNMAKTLLEEYQIGDYYSEFTLSNNVDQQNISASLTNGVLKLIIPKMESAKPRRIEIKTS